MKRLSATLVFLVAASAASGASAAPPTTDFGVRLAPGSGGQLNTPEARAWSNVEVSGAVAVASRLGRVTSTTRTPARNRAVGGVPNSYHLSGRAIDVVRKAGVRHSDIEAELRAAGFHLVESLDEGDHSHFAFGDAPAPESALRTGRQQGTQWRIVSAPRSGLR